jgi:hypothetical protein
MRDIRRYKGYNVTRVTRGTMAPMGFPFLTI